MSCSSTGPLRLTGPMTRGTGIWVLPVRVFAQRPRHQRDRHLLAESRGYRGLCPPTQSSTGPTLPAATWRRSGVFAWRARMKSEEEGPIQASFDLRVHPRPLAQLEPAGTERTRHRKGPRRRALVRAHQQTSCKAAFSPANKGFRVKFCTSRQAPPRTASILLQKLRRNPKASQERGGAAFASLRVGTGGEAPTRRKRVSTSDRILIWNRPLSS